MHHLEVVARREGGLVDVGIQGWQLTLALDTEGLAHCVHCQAPGGEQAGLEHWQRYGTNPTDLLSLWEITQPFRAALSRSKHEVYGFRSAATLTF
ncbi:hypothetical protein [Pseudomonas sp. DCA-1]|uniref:DUF7693 family protein n=1 Tax=Pseudomonas sp. DCA-1 TaxID=3344874 RepID=UPI00397776F3